MFNKAPLIPLVLFPILFLWVGIGIRLSDRLYGPHVGTGIDWRRVLIAAVSGGIGTGISLAVSSAVERRRAVKEIDGR